MQGGFFPDSLIGQVVGRQSRAGRDQIDVRKAGLADDRARIGVGAGVEQGFDARQRISFCQKAFGDVALGVGVDDQHSPGAFLADTGEQPSGVGLAHAAFEVYKRDRLCSTVAGAEHGGMIAAIPKQSSIFHPTVE